MNNKKNVNVLKECIDFIQSYKKEIIEGDFDIVLNASLLKGISSYWHPLCQALEEYSNWKFSREEKNTRIQDIWNNLAREITSDYLSIQEIEVVQKDFDEIYPHGFFTNPTQRQEEFQRFLESLETKEDNTEK